MALMLASVVLLAFYLHVITFGYIHEKHNLVVIYHTIFITVPTMFISNITKDNFAPPIGVKQKFPHRHKATVTDHVAWGWTFFLSGDSHYESILGP